MEKIIYHGSDHIIEKPKFGYGKPYNDYGVGFYCTENPNMAKEWGVGIDHNGYANQYRIECDGLTILDLNTPDYTMLHWLTILLENREFDASAPLAAEAKAQGFALMLGCMLCTSRAIAAALPLVPLARFADLDGPTWLAVDVEPALHFSTGVLHL